MMFGLETGGLVAIATAALDDRVTRAAVVDALASFVTDVPYERQRLALMVPSILREIGDIAHIAALLSPRPLAIVGGRAGDGRALRIAELEHHFAFTGQVYSVARAPKAAPPSQVPRRRKSKARSTPQHGGGRLSSETHVSFSRLRPTPRNVSFS